MAYVREQARLHGDEGEAQADELIHTPQGWEEPFYVERLRESFRRTDEPGRGEHAWLDRAWVLELFAEWTRKQNPAASHEQQDLHQAVVVFRHWQARRRT